MDLCSIPFVLTFLWVQQSYAVMKRSMIGVFSPGSLLSKPYWLLLRWVCLPVFQTRPDDGFIQLRNLPLQHGPQAFSKAVVVLL